MLHSGLLLQDRYRVVKKLGQGGFGQTFEVEDRGVPKVLKVLRLDRFQNPDGKKKVISLFQREATVLSRLQHPGIPKVEPDGYFTIVEPTGDILHCLVMEKIEGLNLKQWLEQHDNQPISQDLAIAWLKQLSDILDRVHQQDLVHRDIKPSNIMLRPNGQLVLVDFGAVRELTDTFLQKQDKNITGTVIISTGYTPPEQAEGKAVPQSDFFALGRTFVYLLTGKNPGDFDRDPRNGKLNWRDSAPQISQQLADLIDYLMAVFPGRRPQTPKILLRCLEEIVFPAPSVPTVAYSRELGRGVLTKPNDVPSSRQESRPQTTQSSSPTFGRKQKPLLALIANFLSTKTPIINPWQKTEVRRTLSDHTDIVRAVAISPDGQMLVSGSYDRTIKLWSLRTGELLQTLTGHSHRVSCLAISPDGQLLASGSYDRTIKLWALPTGELLHTLTGHLERIRSVAFSPNSHMLISSALQIKLWAVLSGKLLRTLGEHTDSSQLTAFSPDGQTCVSGSLDGTLEIWNPHSGKLLRSSSNQASGFTSSGITSLVFSPDGQAFATGGGTSIQIWNPHTMQRYNSFSTQLSGITSLAFSPDGQTLAVGCGKTIELWNLDSGKRMCILCGHTKTVESVTFSPARYILVSGSGDQKIKIWQPVP
jgi:WD40 repeat protein/tRNA A-37 threonylcarbamoyl transferase component Bud32